MTEYGGWVTLGDSSPKPPEKSGSWLKPIHLTKSELLHVDTFLVNIQLPNEVMVIGVPAMKGVLNETDALIGMNIINQGDFAVTNLNGRTKFSFRYPSLVDIDFVEEEKNT